MRISFEFYKILIKSDKTLTTCCTICFPRFKEKRQKSLKISTESRKYRRLLLISFPDQFNKFNLDFQEKARDGKNKMIIEKGKLENVNTQCFNSILKSHLAAYISTTCVRGSCRHLGVILKLTLSVSLRRPLFKTQELCLLFLKSFASSMFLKNVSLGWN